jgi:hypothetical protein
MAEDVLEIFLRQPHIGVLASLRRDGRPYTVPLVVMAGGGVLGERNRQSRLV